MNCVDAWLLSVSRSYPWCVFVDTNGSLRFERQKTCICKMAPSSVYMASLLSSGAAASSNHKDSPLLKTPRVSDHRC